MKRFATSLQLSHYWEIDDSVIGFVAGPERCHVSMQKALLYGQRQMLAAQGEGLGIFGFECWQGIDGILTKNDVFLKANVTSIYKVSLAGLLRALTFT